MRAGDTTRVELRLQAEAQVLNAVRTEARPVDRELFDSKPAVGTVQITARAAEGVPKLGEPDVLRIVQLLPGVEARNDFSTGFNVRGGEADQNLILLDGYPIYNPFHVGGLFSTFIDPTVGDITLMTGGFPARYGSRLSSVLDVHSADEARAGVHGTAELSLLSSTGELGGSFDHGKASWMVAGRRTYADEFVSLISNNQLPYHFRDEQAHFSYAFSPTTRLTVTAYDGRDVLDANIAAFSDTTGTNAAGGTFLFDWGNTVAGATLTSSFRKPGARWLFGDSATAEQHLSRSRFSTRLDLGAGSLTLANTVIDTRIGGSITAHTASHERTLGYDAATFTIDYGASSPQTETFLYALHQRPTSGALFVDDLWRPSSSWLLETGLRGEAYNGAGFSWLGISPRVSAKYFVTPEFAVTAAVGKFTQGMHSLAREDIPVRLFDFWVASDSVTPVSSAWHYVTGAEKWFGTSRYVRVEGFYKRYSRLLDANPSPDPDDPRTNFFSVGGESYGADVLLRQFERGPFSGWIAYTYAVATRQLDSLHYFPGHDRRHDFNFVANWRAKKYLIGLRFGYATGTPYTDIVGEIVRRIYDPGLNSFGTRGGSPQNEFIGGTRDGARLPATQRLDFSVTRTYSVRGTSISPYLSVVNAYYAKNVFMYVFDYLRARRRKRRSRSSRCCRPPVSRFISRARPVALSALVAVAGCELSTVAVPPTTPTVVVHAVMNPSAADQIMFLERTLTGRVRVPGHQHVFNPNDPIVSAGGIPISGALVEISDSSGSWWWGSRASTFQPNGKGRGVYSSRSSAASIRLGAAVQAPRAHARRERTSPRSRGSRCPRCRRPGGSRERSIATTTR